MLPHILWLINPNRFHSPCRCRLCYVDGSSGSHSGIEHRGEPPAGYMPYHPGSAPPHPYYQYSGYQQGPVPDYYRIPYPQHSAEQERHVLNY